MKGLPPELDRLMWAVAEDGGEQPIHEFVGRYPQYRGELMHRVNMVAGLRTQVRQPVRDEGQIPRFTPRESVQSPNPRIVSLALALGVAALAAASYTALSFVKVPPHTEPPKLVAVAPAAPIQTPAPVFTNPSPTPPPPEANPKSIAETTGPAYLRPQARIAIKDESLLIVLQSIAAESGMKIEVGPGFTDQRVSVDYHDTTPLDALQDMAKQYAFTVFDEGNGKFLVLPVADSVAASSPADTRPTKRIGP